MPLLTHGGPGRAGGGEEMGGIRGIKHYLQRTAIQGHPTDNYCNYRTVSSWSIQPIQMVLMFLENILKKLMIGDTVLTDLHTVTTADIENFADVSGDNFYAHMDETFFGWDYL